MKKALTILGWKVKDKLTGFTGVVSHVGIDVSGCVQAIVKPPVTLDDKGSQKMGDGDWFDVARLEKIGDAPIFKPIPQKGTDLTAGCDNKKPLK
jgi:hypothetical protein